MRVEGPAGYFAQGYYASMGFGVPGAIGAQIGTGRRPLVLCGDGAFQMTGPGDRPGAAPRLQPDRAAAQQRRLGHLPAGRRSQGSARLPRVAVCRARPRLWGGWGARVETVAELRDALAEAGRREEFAVVEVIIDPDDHSPVARKYIAASVRTGQRK